MSKGLFGRLKDAFGGWNISNPNASLLGAVGAGTTDAGIYVGRANALTVSAVYACVRNIAEDVAKLPAMVYKEDDKGNRAALKGHTLSRLLRRPNAYHDRFQFMEMLAFGLAFQGNAYIVTLRNARGTVTELIPIQPQRVTVMEAQDGELFFQINRSGGFEQGQLRGKDLNIPARDVIHVKLASLDGVRGASPLEFARQTIGLSLTQQKYQSKLLGNGAKPGGVLTVPTKLSDESYNRMKLTWSQVNNGMDNAGRTAILEEGVKWEAMGMSSVDAEFMAGRKMSVEEVARFWRMPPHMIGELSRSTNNNIAHQGAEYYNNTLSSYLGRFEEAFAKAFDLDTSEYVEFDTDQIMRMDMASRFKAYRDARAAFFMTTNEIRRREGLPPVPGGDKIEVPANLGNSGGDNSKDPEDGEDAETSPGKEEPGE